MLEFCLKWLFALIIITIIVIEIVLAITIVLKRVLVNYKRQTADLSVTELLTSLNAIMENEITIYERSIFEGGRKITTNAQFDNYYNDIVNRIIDDLSPEFFDRMSYFMKKEAVVALICRTIKAYLADQILK